MMSHKFYPHDTLRIFHPGEDPVEVTFEQVINALDFVKMCSEPDANPLDLAAAGAHEGTVAGRMVTPQEIEGLVGAPTVEPGGDINGTETSNDGETGTGEPGEGQGEPSGLSPNATSDPHEGG